MSRVVLDCRNLLCPMPVIRVQNRVAELTPGDELEAVCTDPGALNDIPAWCRINGHEVLGQRIEEGVRYIVLLRVGRGNR
jgi:TusA-related sulfurtransferase